MNRSQRSYLLILGALFLFGLGAVSAWLGGRILSGGDSFSNAQIALGLLLGLLLFASAIGLYRFTQIYFFHLQTLANQARLILTTNPQHRAQLNGPLHLQNLAQTLNDFAHQFEQMRTEQAAQIAQARADLEMERNRLSALLAELTEGVLVCNMAGQILLYNRRAAQLLGATLDEQSTGGFIGLDRPVVNLIDGGAIEHAQQELQHRWANQQQTEGTHEVESPPPPDIQARFVATAANGRLIRVRMAPIADAEGSMNGFVLAFDDVTHEIARSDRQQSDFQHLQQRLRGGLANIRAAIETVTQHPDMPFVQLQQFHQVIQDEVLALSSRIGESAAAYEENMHTVWRLEEMHGADLLQAIQRSLHRELALSIETDESTADLWLRVESYTLLRGYLGLLKQLQAAHGVQFATLRLAAHGQFAALDLLWRHRLDSDFVWQQLQSLIMTVDASDAILTLREVADRHHGEAWLHRLPDGDDAASANSVQAANVYARLLLPLTKQPAPVNAPATFGRSLANYDFALLQQTPRHAELDLRPLDQLAYTVFDTETTGLDPHRDQIVSLAAVRIVNGRLREDEALNLLVDPGRSIPAAATAIHGITNEMAAGQMAIAQAFPQFLRFAEGAVLLGHNVAFDMRLFQQLPQAAQLTHPVLDTLLLSAVLHPDQDDHSLEHMAAQLGISVTDRHTALGDSLLTARVFLRMLPLLADRGIHTLEEARQACAASYMGKIRY
ncbi:MAG: exonuclease domain-containing protein [Caldilineaceae bacterium]